MLKKCSTIFSVFQVGLVVNMLPGHFSDFVLMNCCLVKKINIIYLAYLTHIFLQSFFSLKD